MCRYLKAIELIKIEMVCEQRKIFHGQFEKSVGVSMTDRSRESVPDVQVRGTQTHEKHWMGGKRVAIGY